MKVASRRMCVGIAAVIALAGPSLLAMPSTEVPRGWKDSWAKRFSEKLELAKAGGSKVVFMGDSITHNWEQGNRALQQWNKYFAGEPFKALNLGFSGDRTEYVLWRIAQGELDGYEAKVVMLMIGTNNIGARGAKESVIDTVVGVWRIIRAIRAKQPNARVVLHPIFPRGEHANDFYRVHINKINHELQKLADGRKVIWIDFNDAFLEPDGTIPAEVMPDYLHPRAYGYEVWAAAIKPAIDWALTAKDGDFYPNRLPRSLRKGEMSHERNPALRMSSRIGERRPEDSNPDWWTERLAEKQEAVHALPKGEVDLLFVGDSALHDWQGPCDKVYSVLNLGFRDDGTEQVLWRLANGELDGYRTKCVMLAVGADSTWKPTETAAGVRAILDLVAKKQPQAKTILVPVFPKGQGAGESERARTAAINELTRKFADGEKVVWCDIGEKSLWADAVAPLFRQIVGK